LTSRPLALLIALRPPISVTQAKSLAEKSAKSPASFAAFISHAKADAKKAQSIASALEERGLRCWIAPRDVTAGRAYGDEIIRGIGASRNFVLVLSNASNDSAFVAREVERAASKKKPIFAVRIAEVEPAPALELFVSGTQWIDAFRGKLAPHVDRLADLIGEEEAGPAEPAGSIDDQPTPAKPRPWLWPSAAGAVALIAIGTATAVWLGSQSSFAPELLSSSSATKTIVPAIDTDPVSRGSPEVQALGMTDLPTIAPGIMSEERAREMTDVPDGTVLAGAATGDDGRPGLSNDIASTDPDFRACEKLTGKDGIEACNRAIGSGKFTGRLLSYLYSDRGYLVMQKGAFAPALTDLNKAAEIDPTNFYAYWNRGAMRMAEQDFASAAADFNTALSLNPDPASKAKIEEVLNAANSVLDSSKTQQAEPGIITDPGQLRGTLEGNFPATVEINPAIEAGPPAAVIPVMPASPPLPTEIGVPDRP
jgi:TIR domain/TPR repeat